jgi:hypothetical protein
MKNPSDRIELGRRFKGVGDLAVYLSHRLTGENGQNARTQNTSLGHHGDYLQQSLGLLTYTHATHVSRHVSWSFTELFQKRWGRAATAGATHARKPRNDLFVSKGLITLAERLAKTDKLPIHTPPRPKEVRISMKHLLLL